MSAGTRESTSWSCWRPPRGDEGLAHVSLPRPPFAQWSPHLRCPQALLGSRPHFLTGPPAGLFGEPQTGVQASLRAICHLSLPLGSLCCCLSTLDPHPLSSMPISHICTLCTVPLPAPRPQIPPLCKPPIQSLSPPVSRGPMSLVQLFIQLARGLKQPHLSRRGGH